MGLISIISKFLRTGTFDVLSAVAYVLSAAMVIFLVTPFHECAHAFAAYKLGDPTAKNMGRLSLNPFRHIDWIGAALIMAVGFGWANPVPVNSRNFRNPKGGMALTALAGPVSNLIPIPPLDGSRLLTALLPDRIYYKIMAYERYISFILIAIVVFGVLDYPLSYLTTSIYNALNAFTALPFGG